MICLCSALPYEDTPDPVVERDKSVKRDQKIKGLDANDLARHKIDFAVWEGLNYANISSI